MKFEFDEKAKLFIKEKNITNFYIQLQTVGCWGTSSTIPVVKAGEPKHKELYNFIEVDNLNIYVNKNIETKDKIMKLTVERFLFSKMLAAYID